MAGSTVSEQTPEEESGSPTDPNHEGQRWFKAVIEGWLAAEYKHRLLTIMTDQDILHGDEFLFVRSEGARGERLLSVYDPRALARLVSERDALGMVDVLRQGFGKSQRSA